MEPDFSGYATKAGLKCSDGLTILAHAFKDQDGHKVPLMWQHMHNNPENVLGHAILENREDGVYANCFFNQSDTAKVAKEMVRHGDIVSLSIYANQLKKTGFNVTHGAIREVSLVIAGANPGASIQNVNIVHGDGEYAELEDEAIIFTGLNLAHKENSDEGDNVAGEKTVKDVYDSLTDEQKEVVHFMIGEAIESAEAKHSEDLYDEDEDDEEENDEDDENVEHSSIKTNQEGNDMSRNVFESNGKSGGELKPTLTHDQLQTIVDDAKRYGGSYKESFLAHAQDYGITDIDILFPDAKALSNTPELLKRQTEWVAEVIGGTKHSPFAKIKTVVADITADEARARGYVKGNEKKDEIIALLKRTTDPTTIYKKQKLDRDDMVDITDLDVVAWLKQEMRLMLNEEIARAILIGDGRGAGDDKIDEAKIRPIVSDADMYTHKVTIASNATPQAKIEAMLRARQNYRGTGEPTLFTTLPTLTDLLLAKDAIGRRLYESSTALASALMAKKIVTVEVMETMPELVGIYVSLSDYVVGSNKGGQISMFDDFDIDFNQYKYLMETRISGALVRPKAAVVIKTTVGQPAVPISPSWDALQDEITINAVTGISYFVGEDEKTGTFVITESTTVTATADEGYYIPSGTINEWTFAPTE